MSFTSEIKEELTKLNSLKDEKKENTKEELKSEN